MIKNNKKIDICNYLEILLGLLVIVQAIKKGGFYISDMNYIILFTLLITISIVIIKMKKKEFKVNMGFFLLLCMSIAYMLPVIFNKFADKESAMWEALKYFEMSAIYLVVINSNNKRKYNTVLIILGVVVGALGIDGLANRYLSGFLKIFNSGYLSTYLERLSGTVQYANTCAIILMVAYLLSLNVIAKVICSVKENYNMKNLVKYKYITSTSGFLLLCLLLTQSRVPIILTLIGTIVVIAKEKSNNRPIYFLVTVISYVISMIFANIIDMQIYNDFYWIYFITILYLFTLVIIFNILLSRVIMNVKVWYKLDNPKGLISKKGVIIVILAFGIYVLLALTITVPITVSSNSKNVYIEKSIDVGKDELEDVVVSVKEIQENSKYTVEVYEIDSLNISHLALKFDDSSSEKGNFKASYRTSEYADSLYFKIECKEGKVQLEKISVNGKNIKLNYVLIPSIVMYRFEEKVIGSISNTARIEYIKDAIKIFKTSPFIGRGGEAFRYLYKDFQESNYTSTEVHSSFVQILIESGIIGEIFIISFVVYTLLKGKNGIFKIIFILFTIHSMFDLNFSYAVSTMIFAMISGAMTEEYEVKIDEIK
ncbi:MAG: O-antigen ligase family protein [Clostridia bacterium]|nr:O-antigen ligase family protein [Clostridia bacterium]